LRLKAAAGHIEDLATGSFAPVIDDARVANDRASVTRVVLCSGKIYYDMLAHEDYAKLKHTAIVRLELLSPLPIPEILAVLEAYPNLTEVVWVQEEPKNMGARAHVRRRLVDKLPNGLNDIGYIGRGYRASPSEGYGGAHALEQERIVKEALAEG
jgi:2-oxoglutarate dehydrogenase E1 component